MNSFEAVLHYGSEIVLDRLSFVEPPGWTLARTIGAPHAVLRFLEREGVVESSLAPGGSTTHWRLKPGARK